MNLKPIAVTLSLCPYASLFMPLYKADINSTEGFCMTIRGFNLLEFSPWGCVLFAMPVVILKTAYSHLIFSTKKLLLFLFCVFSTIPLHIAAKAASSWMYKHAASITAYEYILLYPSLILIASALWYVHICNNPKNNVS